MKLLPPKPPTSAGTAKSVKKKEKKETEAKDASVPEQDQLNSLNNTAPVENISQESQAEAGSLNPESADKSGEVPSISPADDLQNLDATLAEINKEFSSPEKEKKKGLFARLFGKKEKVYAVSSESSAPADVSVPSVKDEIQPVETSNISAEKTSPENNPETPVPSPETLEDVASDADLPSFDSEAPKNYEKKDYSPSEAWNSHTTDAVGLVASNIKSYDSKEYKKENYMGKEYSKNYSSYSLSSKYSKKEDFSNVDDIELPENWDSDSKNVEETEEDVDFTVDPTEKDGVSKSKKAVAKQKELKGAKLDKSKKSEKYEEEEVPEFAKEEPVTKKISSGADFTEPINDWKNQVIISLSKIKGDSKSVKQFNAKMKKMLKDYEAKLARVASAEKKNILAEIKKANDKIADIGKKEKELSAKEQKLLHLGKSLSKEREEFDELVETEQQLMKNKEILEADVLKYAKELASLKEEMSSVRKAFNADKKTILYEKEKLQSDFKDLKLMIENEKKKGEKKLLELSKQVELAQSELDETIKKNRAISFKLKSKEAQLQQREKEVSELIAQEQKIISVLKGGDQSAMEHHSIRQRKKKEAPKPVTVIDVDGEPEIYKDEGDEIENKIKDCKDIIKEGNFADAKLLYNEIRSSFVNANVDAEKKKEIAHEIRELYDEICLGLVSPKN